MCVLWGLHNFLSYTLTSRCNNFYYHYNISNIIYYTVIIPSWLHPIYLVAPVKLLAANQLLIGHSVSKCLPFSFLTFHFCHLNSVQNPAADTVCVLTMLWSLSPQSPSCELDSLPQPSSKSCLDVSCSFLQSHWGDVAASPQGCRPGPHTWLPTQQPALLKSWALPNPHTPSLCCSLSSSASVHTGTLLASLTRQLLAGCLQRSGTFQQQLHLLSHKIPPGNVASMNPA